MARIISYREAVNEALRLEMKRDPLVISFGEDVGPWGGSFGATAGLSEEFGTERNFDAPISETVIAGGAVGMAITGLRPVAEIEQADFFAVAMDEIYNKAAKWRYMHGGLFEVPLVYRTASGIGGGTGPEQSQSPESLFVHCPGIKIVLPSTPYDAKGLLITAIRDNNPVFFFEHKRLYSVKGEVPEESYEIPFGQAAIRQTGADVTIVAWSLMVPFALTAAKRLADDNIHADVIDLRTLYPLDKAAILESVRKTGRLVIVHEAPKTGGAGAEIAAIVAEEAIYDLKAPIVRVCGKDVPIPQSTYLEPYCIPQVEDIVAGVQTALKS